MLVASGMLSADDTARLRSLLTVTDLAGQVSLEVRAGHVQVIAQSAEGARHFKESLDCGKLGDLGWGTALRVHIK